MLMLARIIRIITALIVGVIVIGILLHVFEANESNGIVSAVYDIAGWFVEPFKQLFSLDERKVEIAVNWGIGAIVYAVVGGLVASLLARAAGGRRRSTNA